MGAARIAEALAKCGDEVEVVSLHPHPVETLEETNGIPVHRLPIDNLFWTSMSQKPNLVMRSLWHLRDIWNQTAAARIGRILDRVRPDVVNTHNLTGISISVWGEAKKRGLRVVHTMHDYYLLCVRSTLYRYGRTCEKRCMICDHAKRRHFEWSGKIDCAVSVSRFLLNQHTERAYFPGTPTTVIRPIVSLERKLQAEPRKADSDVLTFGFIGQVIEEKGIVDLLEATRRLPAKNWRLKIAGSGKTHFVAQLQKRFPDPRIEFLGFCKQYEFYDAVDVVVVPSRWPEPLGIIPMECFAANRSLICARVGGLPEMTELGTVVRMFRPTDVDDLAAAMNEALQDADRWRTGGFLDPDGDREYSADFVARRYHDVFLGQVAKNADPPRL
jgi:glycosyltransferase involved in cell wall biosynthesis